MSQPVALVLRTDPQTPPERVGTSFPSVSIFSFLPFGNWSGDAAEGIADDCSHQRSGALAAEDALQSQYRDYWCDSQQGGQLNHSDADSPKANLGAAVLLFNPLLDTAAANDHRQRTKDRDSFTVEIRSMDIWAMASPSAEIGQKTSMPLYGNSVYGIAVDVRRPRSKLLKVQDILKALGQRIRELRLKQGYSQEGFADHCSVHRTLMGTIERGESNLSFSNRVKVSSGLGIAPSKLLSGLEKKASSRPVDQGR